MTTTTMTPAKTPATTKVTTLRFLEIDGTPGPARYRRIVDVDVNGQDYRAVFDRAVARDRLPEGAEVTPPASGLDIDLARATGSIAFAVRLPDFSAHTQLSFLTPPVIVQSSNFEVEEVYLSDIVEGGSTEGRWASFVCHIDGVRGSKLAARIKEVGTHGGGGGEHGTVAQPANARDHVEMLLPFVLNLIDRKLGCAPWMVPAEAATDTDPNHFAILTHGGVHPLRMSSVMIDL